MQRATISVTDKQRLLDCFNSGHDYLAFADNLGIKENTARQIVRRANNRDGVVAIERGGRRQAKMDNQIVELLVRTVEHHPSFTLAQLNQVVRTTFPNKPHMSNTTISRGLSGALIVMKQLEDCPIQRNTPQTKELRFQYADWFLNQMMVPQEKIYIDEAGINLWMKRQRGRALRGQRAVRIVGGQRGGNFTIVFAVSSTRGLINHRLMDGGMTSVRFNEFLQETSQDQQEVQLTYIFDNASCHLRALQPNIPGGPQLPAQHSTRRLPPYSPFLNMVENAISAFKSHLKRRLEAERPEMIGESVNTQRARLSQLAEEAVVAITPQKSRNWFNRTHQFLPRCLDRIDILM